MIYYLNSFILLIKNIYLKGGSIHNNNKYILRNLML